MLDEFDDAPWPTHPVQGATSADGKPDPVPRLITRMYTASDAPLRVRLLQRMLDPLGTLGLAAIAAGAFAGFLQRRSGEGIHVSIEDVSRFTSEQIAELVRFVGQVSPESLQAVANTFAENPAGITALGASAVLLLMQAMKRAAPAGSKLPRSHEEMP